MLVKEKMESQSETSQTVSALKLLVLKAGEYDLWIIPVASTSAGAEGPIPPKTTEQKLARKNELKAKSTLMLAIPDEHLLKFHACKDAKSLWEAIKNRFGGNKESKKMQKTILKQNYENFEDANLKLLRSLPSAWNNIALIMRNKSDLDTLSMDDLYNNLKVYESEIKGKSSSSLNSQNVAFVSSDNSSSTNETVNTAHSVSAASSKDQASTASYADDVMFSFFSNQSNAPQLDNEDLEQIDADDLEEMDLKWQVAMLTIEIIRGFIKKTGRKLDLNSKGTIGFDKTKVECYNCHRRGHFARECRAPRNQGNRNRDDPRRNAPVDTSTTNALVVQDGIGGYDWSFQAEEGITNFALMAYTSQGSSSSSSSDSEVHTCSKDCLKSYETLQKQYDQQREALNKSNLEIIGYQMGLESLEARIVVHEKNEVVYEEDIAFLKYDVQFETSSKNLTKLINSQITAKDKTGLGFDEQVNESEVLDNVFDSHESDRDDNPVNDRFKKVEGYHAVPPPYTGNYMPSRPDLSFAGLDDSVYKTKVSETETSISKTSKDIVEKPKTVRPSAPIIEEWDTDSDNDMPVNAAKQSSPRAATSISTARPVNTAAPKPKVNDALQTTYSYFKAHSPVTRPFNQKLIAKTNNCNEKVNTARVNNVTTAGLKEVVSAAEGNRNNAIKSSACWIWRPTGKLIDHISKDCGSYILKRFDYGNPQYALQDQGIFNSGCSRHMTGNKSYLSDYQDIDGGFVAFAGSAKGVSMKSINKKSYCLVVTDDFSRFSWVFFLATKDETPEILKNFITGIENQTYHKVKTIRCDNGTEFKNRIMNEFCEMKGIRREFSVARTPQQNGIAKRKNRTLIEAARTILVDSKLPTTFWAEAVNTACYVQNRVLVIKPHNKTLYEVFLGRKPALSFMRPFGCPVIILNTLDHLGSDLAAGSDTFHPMLDGTDYDSWSQRIRLYCRGKENGIYILQSIDHGPFELGTTRDTLETTPEGGFLLGPERPRTYDDLNDNNKKRFDADVRATNIVLQAHESR
ncbi:ribonuclease H-like domain-containing protein [Tanacetum coccineum]|uniref:Ribonuclease H-like domain-containing protein n=1 Tax=Tanacetum coccineum TaxID=301880 RepID=A0ABQ5HH09_9ASTR